MKGPTIVIIILNALATHANFRCSNESPPRIPKYHLMEKCHRSKLGIAAKANYASLTSCLRLGIEKKALALNFSPPDAANISDPLEYTCEVLKCAEAEGGLSLANDTRFDYYSIYAKPLPNVNATCVPATGMFFLITNSLNYSQAETQCRNMSGVLADVTNEQRTDALAAVLAGASVDRALVGLRSFYGSGFVGTNGDTLDCTPYRAWASGHPRRQRLKHDCVAINRHRMWQSIACSKKLAALCELVPDGPYAVGSIFSKVNDTNGNSNYDSKV